MPRASRVLWYRQLHLALLLEVCVLDSTNTQDTISNFPYLGFRKAQKLSHFDKSRKDEMSYNFQSLYTGDKEDTYTHCFLLTPLEISLEYFKQTAMIFSFSLRLWFLLGRRSKQKEAMKEKGWKKL